MRQRTNTAAGHILPAFLGAVLLVVVAFIVTHIAGLLELAGAVVIGGGGLYCFARWGVPALMRRAYERRELPPRPVYYMLPPDRRDRYRQLPRGGGRQAQGVRVISPEEWHDFYENHR